MAAGKKWNTTLHQWVKAGQERPADYSEENWEAWALLLSYWRWYPDRMLAILEGVESDYSLTLIQAVIQRLFARYKEVFIGGSRGTSKTYNALLSKMCDCILWPGEKVRYFGPAQNQTAEIANKTYPQIEKNYPALTAHFFKTKGGQDTFELVTNLGSNMTISTMRGDNCHQVLCEEVGQEEQPVFDHQEFQAVVIPSVRLQHQVDRRPDPQHIDYKKHYITSACRQQNEAYKYRCDCLKAMRKGKSAFALDIPWQVSVLSGIRTLDWAEDLRSKLAPEVWMREMESRYTGVSENPVIRDAVLTEAKKIEVMETHHCQNPFVFYIIGYDVSHEEGARHAKCATSVTKCTPQSGHKKGTYLKQLVYIKDGDPAEASIQARNLKDLWRQYSLEGSEYPCYIAIDNRQYGKAVTEQLMKDMGDGQPLCCMSHEYPDLELPGALPVIYPVMASNGYRDTGKGDPDGEMLKYAEVQFEQGNVHILTTNVYDGVEAYKKFHRIKDGDDDALFAIPYAKCREMCGQISNLKRKMSGMNWSEVRISKAIQRDMWSCFKYGLRLAQILERKNLAKEAAQPSDWTPAIQAAQENRLQAPAMVGLRPRVIGRTGRLR